MNKRDNLLRDGLYALQHFSRDHLSLLCTVTVINAIDSLHLLSFESDSFIENNYDALYAEIYKLYSLCHHLKSYQKVK